MHCYIAGLRSALVNHLAINSGLWTPFCKLNVLLNVWYFAWVSLHSVLDSSWNVMAHGDTRVRQWRGKWRMEWVASTLHTTSEHGVSSIATADAHTSAASSRLSWRPRRFKWIRPFRRKTKSGFCACAITFQTQSTSPNNEIYFFLVSVYYKFCFTYYYYYYYYCYYY